MRDAISELEVSDLSEKRWKRVDCQITETGSGLPRALLAYYFAVIQTIASRSDPRILPIVIDSPRQQDPDEVKWPKVLNFLLLNRPAGSQMIVSLRDTAGITARAEVVELIDEKSLLRSSDYADVRNLFEPFLQQLFEEQQGSLFS